MSIEIRLCGEFSVQRAILPMKIEVTCSAF